MRMLRVALVLLVLASFVGATVIVSMAATVTPTAKATMKPTGTMAPIKKTGKMIDMQQMKSTIGDVYKKLIMGMKAPTRSGKSANNTTAMGGVNKTASGMNQQRSQDKYSPSMKLSTPSMRSIPAPAALNQLSVMPIAGSEKTKTGNATGKAY